MAPKPYPTVAAEQARALLDHISDYVTLFCPDLPEPRLKTVDAYLRRADALILLAVECKKVVSAERFALGRKARVLGSVPDLDPVPDGRHPLAPRGVRCPGVPVDLPAVPVLVDAQPEEVNSLNRLARTFVHALLSEPVSESDEVAS